MANLEQILNVAVPIGIILVFSGLIYTKMKEPIDQVIKWIKGLFGWGREQVSSTAEKTYEMVYR